MLFMDIFSQPVDFDNNLRFIVNFIRKIGVKKGTVFDNYGCIGFEEKYRLFGNIISEFFRMICIIPTNAYNLHTPYWLNILNLMLVKTFLV